ncbi:MAG TPA: hypothetical protein VH120_07065 [Gemmataceae bacterium]|nr:hypothetical protein [Gemmataceae bacterium]
MNDTTRDAKSNNPLLRNTAHQTPSKRSRRVGENEQKSLGSKTL